MKPWEPSEAFDSLCSSVRLRVLVPLAPLIPCSPLSPEHPWIPGTSLGPQEALGAFGNLLQPWVLSQIQGPCSPCSPSHPLPLTSLPSEHPCAPGTSLGPQEAFGAFESLYQLWVFSQTQGSCSPCSPSPLAPLAPPCSPCLPSIPGPLEPSLGLRKPWELSEAFGSLGSLVRLRGLVPPCPLTPPHPLASSPPGHPWAPTLGLRKPWEYSEAFVSLGSSVTLGGLVPLAPSLPLAPSPFLLPSPLCLKRGGGDPKTYFVVTTTSGARGQMGSEGVRGSEPSPPGSEPPGETFTIWYFTLIIYLSE